jgi:AraC-like DNA-binding protein
MTNIPKPHLLKITGYHSFDIRNEKTNAFTNPWHYHPEIELNMVLKSTGTRFVGDNIASFKENELVLLGPNLPHYWQSDKHFSEERGAEAIILRFKKDLWGVHFWDLQESKNIQSLFHKANKGILFDDDTTNTVKPLLYQLLQAKGGERMWLWIQIFETLAHCASLQILSKTAFTNTHDDSDRIDKVLNYIQDHLSENIDLETVAQLANMNTAAFCRYFKQQTNKTFVETLNDIRINYACRLLLDSDKTIGQICYDTGFQNIPYFNQVFKQKMAQSPSQFKRLHLG